MTAFVRKPSPLEPGKVRCAGCGVLASLTKTGKLRAHNDPDGIRCTHRATYAPPVKLDRDNLPPVVLPRTPKTPPPPQRPRPREPKPKPEPEREPSRLDVGSSCEDCGRWLPGERHVCGRCAVRRNRERNKKR